MTGVSQEIVKFLRLSLGFLLGHKNRTPAIFYHDRVERPYVKIHGES